MIGSIVVDVQVIHVTGSTVADASTTGVIDLTLLDV